MRIPIAEAEAGQILRFLQTRLGQNGLKPNTGKVKLVEKLATLWTEDFIEVDDDEPNAGNAGPKSERAHYAEPPKSKVDPLRFGALDPQVTIKINSEKTKGGDRNVACHLNGVEFFIPRNKPVPIPYRYFKVLEEAVGDIHDGWDDKERRNSEARETQSYTYTVLKMPSDEAIARWERDMKAAVDVQRKKKMRRIVRTRQLREEEAAFA